MERQCIAIDGNSLMYRAFFALPDMLASDGTPTGALHGFFAMLLKLLEREPTHLVVAFDMHGPTFRHESYAEYKAGRKPMPDALRQQMDILHELLDKMGVRVCQCEGYEADDVIGTVARACQKEGIPTLLVTGDRDALQLITDDTHVLLTKRGISDTVEMTPDALMEAYGLTPDAMRDLKALMGDSSDNIPGIPGVGEKTALKLMAQYGSLENILAHAAEVPGKLGERLSEHAESGRMSYRIGTICTSAPIGIEVRDCAFSPETLSGGAALLERLELRSILQRIPQADSCPGQRTDEVIRIPIHTVEEVRTLASEAERSGTLAVTLSPVVSFAANAARSYELTAGETLFDEGPSFADVVSILAAAFPDGVPCISYDGKQLLHALRAAGLTDAVIMEDAMLMEYLIHANRPADSIAALCRQTLHVDTPTAAHLFPVCDALQAQMRERELSGLYRDMELPLQRVLFDMETLGFTVNPDVLRELGRQFTARAQQLQAEIFELAGGEFNILSTKQLADVLYQRLRLPPSKKTKTGFSTDAESLEQLMDRHPVVPLILEYRNMCKLNATFIEGLLNKCSPDDGRIHTRFLQCVTATGRIASMEPNLQNIPVRTETGREIRKAFVASGDNVLVGADYSQIELRVLAHLSGDEGMMASFRAGEDIHLRTASEVFHVPMQAVTAEQRGAAKAVNFGIVYGISDFGLARNLGIPVKRASGYIERYFERYPGIRRYMQDSVEQARERGYAQTLFHRRRPVPELTSANYNTRQFGERVAMNMPIQGTAADMIKLAMVSVDRCLRERGYAARLILQIHDELIVDCPLNEADAVCALVKDCMEHVVDMRVPIVADVKVGKSWFDTK